MAAVDQHEHPAKSRIVGARAEIGGSQRIEVDKMLTRITGLPGSLPTWISGTLRDHSRTLPRTIDDSSPGSGDRIEP
jgi:hypothetical protein